ncbi:MAG: DUF5680 domain-containing protein [Coprobacillus sp.]
MNIGKRIEQYRKGLKLSQEELAEMISVSRQTITKWETQDVLPNAEYLIGLSNIFGVTIDKLVKDNDCQNDIKENNGSTDNFINFLVKAKQLTYSAKKGKVEPTRLDSHDYKYEEDNYKYHDTFVGSEMFAGEETVYQNDKAIYSMNYYGRVLDELFSGDFLKEALMHVSVDMPYRGPMLYKNGRYTYTMQVTGDYTFFNGIEDIYYNDTKVYECVFHGGILK